jgi:hypothetical protein
MTRGRDFKYTYCMSRIQKQLFYGFLYLLLFVAFSISFFFIFLKPAPSCTDGILNQDEEQIDCGGKCSSCELKTIELTVTGKRAFYAPGGRVSFMVSLDNESSNFWAKEFSYELDVTNRKGLTVDVIKGFSSVPPKSKKDLIFPAAYANSDGIGGFDFKIVGQPDWAPAAEYVPNDFFVTGVTSKITGNSVIVSGTVVNRVGGDISHATVYAIFMNKFGEPVNVSATILDNLRLSVPAKFEMSLPYTKGDDLDLPSTKIIIEPQK